jgi:hypothetical protein
MTGIAHGCEPLYFSFPAREGAPQKDFITLYLDAMYNSYSLLIIFSFFSGKCRLVVVCYKKVLNRLVMKLLLLLWGTR